MKSIHKYQGHTIVPDSRGWAVTYKRVTVPPMVEVQLFGATTSEEYVSEFFKTLPEAKAFIRSLNA